MKLKIMRLRRTEEFASIKHILTNFALTMFELVTDIANDVSVY